MAIEFHCVHCSHLIRTGPEHAGKYGRCPHCKNKVYVPTPREELEPLELAPLDESAERERARLLKETQELTRKIISDKEKLVDSGSPGARGPGAGAGPGGSAGRSASGPGAAAASSAGSASHDVALPKTDMETLILEYAICMSDGELTEAAELASEIKKDMGSANKIIQRLMMDEILPAQISRIPRPVLNGFFKQLRDGK